MLQLLFRFLRALFQFRKRAAGEATKFGRSGVKLLGVGCSSTPDDLSRLLYS